MAVSWAVNFTVLEIFKWYDSNLLKRSSIIFIGGRIVPDRSKDCVYVVRRVCSKHTLLTSHRVISSFKIYIAFRKHTFSESVNYSVDPICSVFFLFRNICYYECCTHIINDRQTDSLSDWIFIWEKSISYFLG